MNTSRALKIILGIWIVGFVLTLPLTYYNGLVPQKDDPTINKCVYNSLVGLWLNELTSKSFFLIPMPLILVMYVRIGLELKRSSVRRSELTNEPRQRVPKLLSEKKSYDLKPLGVS